MEKAKKSGKEYQKPKATSSDTVHTVVKAGLSAIPIAGGPAAELFSTIIVPPLSKRRDEWIESIVKGLQALEEKVDSFKIEDLSQNAMFITTVMHASQAAIRNHQREKLEALRNAVLNAALANAPEEDVQLMFLDLVDTLTPWHLRILQFYGGIRIAPRNKLTEVLEKTFPTLKGKRDFYEQIVKDLSVRGLMLICESSLGVPPTGEPVTSFEARRTPLGNHFIDFITSPIESKSEKE